VCVGVAVGRYERVGRVIDAYSSSAVAECLVHDVRPQLHYTHVHTYTAKKWGIQLSHQLPNSLYPIHVQL
jgi:UDP-galactopyranose mutase